MKYLLGLVSVFWIVLSHPVFSQIGNWEIHIPYGAVTSLAYNGDEVLCGINKSSLFAFDPEFESIETYTKLNGYNHLDIVHLNYASAFDLLFVCYKNGALDIQKNDGDIVQINGLKENLIITDKTINNSFILDHRILFAGNFGIAVFDMERLEFIEDFLLGDNGTRIQIYDLNEHNDFLYAATEQGVKRTSLLQSSFSNPTNWVDMTGEYGLQESEVRAFQVYDNQIYCGQEHQLFALNEDSQWVVIKDFEAGCFVQDLEVINNQLAILKNVEDVISGASISFYNNSGTAYDNVISNKVRVTSQLLAVDGKLYGADLWDGLLVIRPESGSVAAYEGTSIQTTDVWRIDTYNNNVYVAPGGASIKFTALNNNVGVSSYVNRNWEYIGYGSVLQTSDIKNIAMVKLNQSNGKRYYGSIGQGLIEIDGSNIQVYNSENSSVGEQEGNTAGNRWKVTGLDFDQNNNLWFSCYDSNDPLGCYTAEGEWYNFQFPSLNTPDVHSVLVDQYGQKWMIENSKGIIVFDEGDDIIGNQDDRMVVLGTGTGNGNLHTTEVFCLVEDKDGEIWIGTADGVLIAYCSGSVLSSGCDVSRPLIGSDEDINYMFSGQVIRKIVVDGGDRKWVATNNGVILVSDDGEEQIEHFTVSNSPLISNVIHDLHIDQTTGILYIATDKGLCSYQTDSKAGTYAHNDVLVYPNPVTLSTTDIIAIEGLVDEANVMITDVAGNVVYKTNANGSVATWDGTHFDGAKVSSGVYLVFSSNIEATESYVAKIFIVQE